MTRFSSPQGQMPANPPALPRLPAPPDLQDWAGEGLCVFARDGAWQVRQAPVETLRIAADDQPGLDALPERVGAALARHPGSDACGLISYEAGRLLHGESCGHAPVVPAAVVYVYAGSGARAAGESRRERRSHISPLSPVSPGGEHETDWRLVAGFESDTGEAGYQQGIARIRDYLAAGDCYQVNYARRFSARCLGDSRAAWLRLLADHPAPHACYFDWGDGQVFGVSPERFIQVRNGRVRTEPIKGSAPRGASDEDDAALARQLLGSSKDRAENLMIVDLLRNDLGRVCLAGSISAEPLFELQRFSNVQHLVSTVSGELRPEVSPLAALLACFPGGSITGAPKKRAMQIIAELEPTARGFYCGSFFHLDRDGNLDSNILIRTLQRRGDVLHCHGGGGITYDSQAEQEYAESLFKVEKLMASVTGEG